MLRNGKLLTPPHPRWDIETAHSALSFALLRMRLGQFLKPPYEGLSVLQCAVIVAGLDAFQNTLRWYAI
jgi:hypothetical protein